MQSIRMHVDGMSCGHCVRSVTQALESLPGVSIQGVSVGSADVSYDPDVTSPGRISEAVGEVGYGVRRVERTEDSPR